MTDGTPLKTVEVQLNEGAWVAAKLDAPPNPYAWTWFRAEFPAPAAARTRRVKATDTLGRTQPANLDMKKTNWENNALWRRRFRSPRTRFARATRCPSSSRALRALLGARPYAASLPQPLPGSSVGIGCW